MNKEDWDNMKEDRRPARGWWAPGGYSNKCLQCGDYFVGDKRAGHCADCAYGDQELRDGLPCGHPGCLSHVTHPCEGCGRIAGWIPKELESCPMCGAKGAIKTTMNGGDMEYYVACTRGCVHTGSYYTEQEAKDIWNRRK